MNNGDLRHMLSVCILDFLREMRDKIMISKSSSDVSDCGPMMFDLILNYKSRAFTAAACLKFKQRVLWFLCRAALSGGPTVLQHRHRGGDSVQRGNRENDICGRSPNRRDIYLPVYTQSQLCFALFLTFLIFFLSVSVKVYKMNFDNAAFKHRMPQQKTAPGYEKLPMKRRIFFDMFPFSVIFRRDMTMYRIRDGVKEIFSDMQGKKVNEEFTLVRPMLEFSWDNVSECEGSEVK